MSPFKWVVPSVSPGARSLWPPDPPWGPVGPINPLYEAASRCHPPHPPSCSSFRAWAPLGGHGPRQGRACPHSVSPEVARHFLQVCVGAPVPIHRGLVCPAGPPNTGGDKGGLAFCILQKCAGVGFRGASKVAEGSGCHSGAQGHPAWLSRVRDLSCLPPWELVIPGDLPLRSRVPQHTKTGEETAAP